MKWHKGYFRAIVSLAIISLISLLIAANSPESDDHRSLGTSGSYFTESRVYVLPHTASTEKLLSHTASISKIHERTGSRLPDHFFGILVGRALCITGALLTFIRRRSEYGSSFGSRRYIIEYIHDQDGIKGSILRAKTINGGLKNDKNNSYSNNMCTAPCTDAGF